MIGHDIPLLLQFLLVCLSEGGQECILVVCQILKARLRQVGVGFPAEEAHWLAAAALNHGLTKYAARQDMTTCQAWTGRALVMAQHADDNGQLAASLQQRRQTLLLNSSLAGTL